MKINRIALLFALLLVLFLSAGPAAAKDGWHNGSHKLGVHITDPIDTDAGYIAGTMIGDVGNEVRIYRGIPYAAPPVGELRWKPPQSESAALTFNRYPH